MNDRAQINPPEDLITVDELARRLGWEPKTIQNKMGKIFIRGVHYDSPPGMPTLFRWSAVLSLYRWSDTPAAAAEDARIPMARGYDMK